MQQKKEPILGSNPFNQNMETKTLITIIVSNILTIVAVVAQAILWEANCDDQVTNSAVLIIFSILATYPFAWLKFRIFRDTWGEIVLSFLFVGSATVALLGMGDQYGRISPTEICPDDDLEVLVSLVSYSLIIPFGHMFKSKEKHKYKSVKTVGQTP